MKPTFRFRGMAAGAFLLATLVAPSVFSQSVTSSWSSGAVGGWENAANWSSGVPLQGTNVLIGGSGSSVVTYSNPVSYAVGKLIMMNSAALTNTLNINTNGFVTVGAMLSNAQVYVNAGGVWTNGSAVSGSGSGGGSATVTINGGTFVHTNGNWGGSGASQIPKIQIFGGLASFSAVSAMNVGLNLTMTAGVLRTSGLAVPRFIGTSLISGGSFTNTGARIQYWSGANYTTTLTNDAVLVTTGFSMDAGGANYMQTFNMNGGLFQITSNVFYLGNSADNSTKTPNQRRAFFNQTAGVVSMTNAAGLVFDQEDVGGTGNTNQYSLQGGTLNLPKITFFGPNATNSLNILRVSGGTLNLGSGGIVSNQPNGSATYEIHFSGGTVGAQGAWSSVLNMGLTNTGVGAVTFRAEDTNGVAKDITLSGTLSGNGGLVKTGGGTLSLNGANTYSGDTAVSNGTLRINGTSSGTGMLGVFSNATLGGTGSLRSVTLADGGRLAPGNSIGTLTVSNLTLNTGSLFDFELAATNASDRVVDLGTLSLAQLNFSNFTFTTNAGFGIGSYVLVDAFNHVGPFNTVTNNSFYGYQGTLLLGGLDGNDLVLTVALPIPEPTVLALLGLGALLALRRSRRT